MFSIHGLCAFQRTVDPKKLWVKGGISPFHEGTKFWGGGREGDFKENLRFETLANPGYFQPKSNIGSKSVHNGGRM